MTRRMVVTTIKGDITEERMLAILPVCCFLGVVISLVSHMLVMAER